MEQVSFTDINGIKVGHAQDFKAATGCTVVICEEGAVAGVDVRGGSPGTRETDALNPVNIRKSIHAVLLAGGSAFGLDAAAGVMQFLEQHNIGRDVMVTKVPIVCGAILFDLKCGDYKIRPDKRMGYEACLNTDKRTLLNGSVGAGTGATIGKIKGPRYAMKGGIGSFCLKTGDLLVGALMAVNCVGDIYDDKTHQIIAGVLNQDKRSLGNTEKLMIENYSDNTDIFSENTVIGVVVTNSLTKYINGHGDALGGAVIGRKELIDRIKKEAMVNLGGVISPFNAWLIMRGAVTLPLRMKQHSESAMKIAQYLETNPAVKFVYYPGLESHPQHKIAKKQMSMYSGMIAFALKADPATHNKFINSLKIIIPAVFLGHDESLIVFTGPDDERNHFYPPEFAQGHLRFSVGLEDANDLIADIGQALKTCGL